MGTKGTLAPPAVNNKARQSECEKKFQDQKVGDKKIPDQQLETRGDEKIPEVDIRGDEKIPDQQLETRGDEKIPDQQTDTRQCSNKNGRGKQCPRPAYKNYRRCEKCHTSNYNSIKRNYVSRMVLYSRARDKEKFSWDPEEYVTRDWLEHRLKTKGFACYWCGKKDLNTRHRLRGDGLQLERLSNELPHLKRNCVFACGYCNRRSWAKKWKEVPFHLRERVDRRLTHKATIIQDRICLEIDSMGEKAFTSVRERLVSKLLLDAEV